MRYATYYFLLRTNDGTRYLEFPAISHEAAKADIHEAFVGVDVITSGCRS